MISVLDAQPVLAFLFREPGAEAARAFLRDVERGKTSVQMSVLDLMEIHYNIARKSAVRAERTVRWLRAMGVKEAGADSRWRAASAVKAKYGVPIGDAFALALAKELGAELVVGDDPDFEAAKKMGVRLKRLF